MHLTAEPLMPKVNFRSPCVRPTVLPAAMPPPAVYIEPGVGKVRCAIREEGYLYLGSWGFLPPFNSFFLINHHLTLPKDPVSTPASCTGVRNFSLLRKLFVFHLRPGHSSPTFFFNFRVFRFRTWCFLRIFLFFPDQSIPSISPFGFSHSHISSCFHLISTSALEHATTVVGGVGSPCPSHSLAHAFKVFQAALVSVSTSLPLDNSNQPFFAVAFSSLQ
ncbi:hypothetical protein QBC32DRAFT_67651 [Pseudoneurospora amorphoporcata]|uniref:Uncharacterized protein n=1 Tax=Pseudoneurospora amorphoporcata TaxID=241081 RepID=A0AAN6SBZ1_9PEZI|nr:hypothetical protein QBC32DRAFT_67651 [Pseudoneurospora amorphoporcata]